MTGNPRTICITGAGSGIGKATALACIQKGFRVFATTETESQAQALHQEWHQFNDQVTIWKLDVTNPEDRETLKDRRIDVMIHNAGVGFTGSLVDVPVEVIRKNFEVNLFSILEINQLLLPEMLKRNSGRIIVISSIAGRIPLPFFGSYGMTKFALSAGMDDLRRELRSAGTNIQVSVVEPGSYHTGFNQRMIESRRNFVSQESPFFESLESSISKDLRQFQLLETKQLDSITSAIMQAITSPKPRFRYSRPYWQAWGVRLIRILGI